MSKQNLYLGKSGEELAVDLLAEIGYKIIARNYKTRLSEIDIIATDKDTICFIEVKSRSQDRFGMPQESISRHKQRQVAKTALMFLKQRNLLGKKARFDVVSVLYGDCEPKLDLIKNAFELDTRFTY